MSETFDKIEELSFSNVIGDRFGRYSKYIIQDRALPDIRDGLKPVQRRILFAMHQDNNTADKAYRKSAKTVGNVIGNYHPHGDSSVYEAMVRMSQSWKNREPLIDMHGNNGSMDGDPAAAMRYTEARLSKIAMELLADINFETVDYSLNFDDTLEEPVVLPARFPNLLVNGAAGISAGYATEIPPHNLGEVIDAVIYMLTHKKYDLSKLMEFVKGPDFPTGGIIQGAENLSNIYKNGQGKVVIRSKTEIETLRGDKQQIVVTELPFEVNKTKLIQRLDDIRLQKKVEGIVEVRDETDRTGVRLVIELRRGVNAEPILNYLLLNTDLQMNYHFNMIAINNRKPELVGLIQILEAYIKHQQEVIQRRTQFKLDADQKRHHIVDGLIRMVSILDEVIVTIRRSESKSDAKDNLVSEFQFTQEQAEAIVSLQLYRLTNTDVTALQNERLELNERIMMYENILKDQTVLNKVLVNEIKEIKKKYSSPRVTQIESEVEEISVEQTLLVHKEQVIVSVTKEGYIKRTSTRSFGSSDTFDLGSRDLDYALFVEEMSTHDAIVILTNKGNYIHLPVNELPDIKWKELGLHYSQNYQLEEGEQIIFVTKAAFGIDDEAVDSIVESNKNYKIVLASKEGMIKQTSIEDFVTYRSYKTKTAQAMKLKTDTDEVISAQLIDASDKYEIVLLTARSYSLRYSLEEVSTYGLKAQGVKAINLKDNDELRAALLIASDLKRPQILGLTQRGNLKRFDASIVAEAKRGGRGILILKELKQNPHRFIEAIALNQGNTPVVLKGDTGVDIEINSNDIAITERLNNGSVAPDLDKLGNVLTMHVAQLKLIDED